MSIPVGAEEFCETQRVWHTDQSIFRSNVMTLEELIAQANEYQTCMSLHISQRGQYVELLLDSSRPVYDRPIKGIVGGDCGLLCDMETDEVIGIQLRLINNKLMVSHEGPIRINEGFLKENP